LLPRDEKIGFPVFLLTPRRARRVGDRKAQVRRLPDQLRRERRFTGTRRRGNDEDRRHALVIGLKSSEASSLEGPHSKLRACSRIFSMDALTSSARLVIFRAPSPAPLVLDRIVLVSRFISCSRKSNFLPASPPPSSTCPNSPERIFRRASSSPMSLRSARIAA